MSNPPMKQDWHPDHRMPPPEHDGVTLSAMPNKPDKMSADWIDRRVEESDYNYRKPVTTGSDFVP